MSHFQSGILLEHRRFAIFLEAMATGDLTAIRSGSHAILQRFVLLSACQTTRLIASCGINNAISL